MASQCHTVTLKNEKFYHRTEPEAYLEPCQTSMMERFSKDS